MSYHERVIWGVISELEALGDVAGITKRRAASPPNMIASVCSDAGFRQSDNQIGGRIPKTLALATACVRLWTPSLPLILRV